MQNIIVIIIINLIENVTNDFLFQFCFLYQITKIMSHLLLKKVRFFFFFATNLQRYACYVVAAAIDIILLSFRLDHKQLLQSLNLCTRQQQDSQARFVLNKNPNHLSPACILLLMLPPITSTTLYSYLFSQTHSAFLLFSVTHSFIQSVKQTTNQSSNPLILFPLFQDFYFRFPFFLVFVKDRSIQQKENRGSREMRAQISRFFLLLLSSHCWFILSSTQMHMLT